MITPEKMDEFNKAVVKAAKKAGFNIVMYAVSDGAADGGTGAAVAADTAKPSNLALLEMLTHMAEHVEDNFLGPADWVLPR